MPNIAISTTFRLVDVGLPGTLNRLLGLHYSFQDSWRVSGATFTAFTLGTLVVIFVISVAGYLSGRLVRRDEVAVGVAV